MEMTNEVLECGKERWEKKKKMANKMVYVQCTHVDFLFYLRSCVFVSFFSFFLVCVCLVGRAAAVTLLILLVVKINGRKMKNR